MISPAFTTSPPNRFTPRRCALESRPLRVELAPFLGAIAVLPSADRGDADAGELLAVALALLVPGLVLELLDDDLLAAQVAEDLRGHRHLGELGRLMGDLLTVDEEHRRELHRAVLPCRDAVERHHGADLDLLLAPTGAHDRIDHFEPQPLLPCHRAPHVIPRGG